jgi:hypothetical protein
LLIGRNDEPSTVSYSREVVERKILQENRLW